MQFASHTRRWLACLLLGSACAAVAFAQVTAAAPPIEQYVGQYRWLSDPDVVMSVFLVDGRLYEEREGRERQEIVRDPGAAGLPDRFAVSGVAMHLVFERDGSGTIDGCKLIANRNGRTLVEETRVVGAAVPVSHYRAYERSEAMLPMRDGVKLHAVILQPKETMAEALPILLLRTPYGVDGNDSENLNLNKPELASSGYIFVFEDIRGRYRSGGRFVMNRPVIQHPSTKDIDETTDAYDTVEWLLKNVPGNNAKVGVYGVSYDGFLAMMAGIDPHPAVKAISPQAPMTDVWLGDDFFHNGAFRAAYGFDYVQRMEEQKTDIRVDMKQDTFDFFLGHTNFAGAAAESRMSDLPTAKAFLAEPTYTKFWRDMAVQDRLSDVDVPTLEVGGYWDQEDMWGTQAQYAALKKHDAKRQVFLVLGPWNHGGWEDTGRALGSEFGALDFGEPTGSEFRKTIEAPFFERYLKDRPGFDLTEATSYRTGVNKWEHYDAWPPAAGFTPEQLYLEPKKRLSFTPPSEGDEIVARYISDPADPVPYRRRPVQSTYASDSNWSTWLVEDQRFVTARKDVASFTMSPLDHDVTITGDVLADLFASTTGSDADWVVKLIDVYPGDEAGTNAGYQLMVADEIFRGRYLGSFERPEALKPGAVSEFKWSLHGVDHTFLMGHSIMVEVQSTWFPLYDRNPQTFVPNIMTAPKNAYKAETMTIYGSARYPSHLEFAVAQ